MKKALTKLMSVLLVLAFMVTLFPNKVYAKSFTLTNEEVKNIKEELSILRIDDKTQDKLIDKVEKGILWDSMSGKKPVRTEKIDKYTYREVWEDGSVAVTEIKKDGREVLTDTDLSYGGVISGSGYSNYYNVKVYKNIGIISAYFFADFSIINGNYDEITNVNNAMVTTIGGTYHSKNLEISRRKEDPYYRAEATLSFVISVGGYANRSCFVKLYVGRDTYFSDFRF